MRGVCRHRSSTLITHNSATNTCLIVWALTLALLSPCAAQPTARKSDAPAHECQTAAYCKTYCGITASINNWGACCADCTPTLDFAFIGANAATCRNGCAQIGNPATTTTSSTTSTTATTARTTATVARNSKSSCENEQEQCRAMCESTGVAFNECASNGDGTIVSQRCTCFTNNSASMGPRATSALLGVLCSVFACCYGYLRQ